jgi:monoamine oxidase
MGVSVLAVEGRAHQEAHRTNRGQGSWVAPVRRTAQDDHGVTIDTNAGTINAECAIITATPAHSTNIEFHDRVH